MTSFTLVWGNAKIAEVVEEDCDLLSIMGSYRLVEGARSNAALRDIIVWHDECVRRAASVNRGRPVEPGVDWQSCRRGPAAWRSWAMVDAEGKRHPIAAPRFLSGGKIVWGWS